MKFKKSWGAFFTAASGIAVTGLTLTAIASKHACHAMSDQALDLIHTLLDSKVGLAGSISMDMIVNMGDSNITVPISSQNLLLSLRLNLNENLIEKIKTMQHSVTEDACSAFMWQEGVQDVLLLLLASAAACGIVFAYRHSQKPEADLENDLENDRAMRFV